MGKNNPQQHIDSTLTQRHLRTTVFKSYIYYIKQFHPEVYLPEVCQEAGLNMEYLTDEDNWVSVIFEKKFMEALQRRIKDKNLLRKVGEFGVQKEVLGKSIFYFAYNILRVPTLYKKLPFVTSLINKVFKIEITNHRNNSISYKVTPLLNNLNPFEREVLLSRMPDYMTNTMGYYAAIPTPKGLPQSKVSLRELEGHAYSLLVHYPHELRSWNIVDNTMVFLSFYAISLTMFWFIIDDYSSSLTLALITSLLGVAFNTFKNNKDISEKTESFSKDLIQLDEQFEKLSIANQGLSRKVSETLALTTVVRVISSSDTEEQVLVATCKSLSQILYFDRSIVFLANSDKSKLHYTAGYGVEPHLEAKIKHMSLDTTIPSSDPKKLSNVYTHGIPILIEDVKQHLSTLEDEISRQILEMSHSSSFAAVPIQAANEKYGVLIADCYHSMKQLSKDDLNIIGTIGSQSAIAIEKARSKENLRIALEKTQKLSQSYSRFVPFEILDQMGYKDVFDIRLGDGALKEFTIFFSDLRDFTSLCEGMRPDEVLKFLNSYYSRLSPIIRQNGGIIDKFIGDCLMAIFVNPLSAVKSGVEIQRALTIYNKKRIETQRAPISCGIGICQGEVILGPLGVDRRMEMTVLSDAVNTASRLDSLCKSLDAKILVAGIPPEDLLSLDKSLRVVSKGIQLVKGKKKSIEVYEIIKEERSLDEINLGESLLTFRKKGGT